MEVFSQSEGKLERSLLWILWKNKTEIVLNMRHSPRADIITYCTAELNLKKKLSCWRSMIKTYQNNSFHSMKTTKGDKLKGS